MSRSTRSRHLKEIAATSGTSYDTDNSDLESESFDSCDFEKDGQDLVSGSYSPRDSEGKTVMQLTINHTARFPHSPIHLLCIQFFV